MLLRRLAFLAFSALFTFQSAIAADIRPAKSARGEPLGAIMIEGEITQGDYVKFINAFIDNPGRNSSVYLYSPGGDFIEALKIGRLIHTLKLTTWAPMSVETDGLPLNEVNDPSNRMCASACFFIFAAGANRFGDIVGIHRPYLPRNAYKSLTMEGAGKTHVAVRQMLDQYFKDIDVSQAYVDRIMSVDSGDIEWLPKQELKKDFNGFVPAYREWMLAQCMPSSESSNDRLLRVVKGMPVSDVNFTPAETEIMHNYFVCSQDVQEREVHRLWEIMFLRRTKK